MLNAEQSISLVFYQRSDLTVAIIDSSAIGHRTRARLSKLSVRWQRDEGCLQPFPRVEQIATLILTQARWSRSVYLSDHTSLLVIRMTLLFQLESWDGVVGPPDCRRNRENSLAGSLSSALCSAL